MDDDRYWPFDVLPAEQRTVLHQQQIDFLQTSFEAGFRPFVFGVENFSASCDERSGVIIRRTRRFWELELCSAGSCVLDAYVAEYEVNANALLHWLRGAELEFVLDFIRPNLVSAGGLKNGYRLEQQPKN